jgi:hypothetical protein
VPDPVSWFLIEPGWKVAGSDGSELGTVQEVTGDSSLDIFDGLAVTPGLLGKTRYVPAELVGEIVEGEITLSIGQDEFERLDEHSSPPRAEQIQPE